MIRNENGITLIVLMITIIVMLILAGIGLGSIYTGINDYQDYSLSVELGLVREVVTEQYEKAKATNKIKIPISSTEEVYYWVGTKIDSSEIEFPTGQTPDNLITNPKYKEECYYRLTVEDQNTLGLQDSSNVYVVNYYTGEVYNETVKQGTTGELLYLSSTVYNSEDETEDLDSFNDWN